MIAGARCRALVGGVAAALVTVAGGACGGGTHSAAKGPVQVLYAASLAKLMESQIGPHFHGATGYSFTGFAGGSQALATEIKGKVRRADIFISASPKVDATLEGGTNGNWVSWYASFAKSPLLLGYNPHSRFAARLRSEPWYRVITAPGFRLGRTDPQLDPKGKLTVEALTDAAKVFHDPALLAIAKNGSGVFPEETLVGRLQSGQLDAGFFYSIEAKEAGIPTISLDPVKVGSTYTVTVVNRGPDRTGAIAFVKFLLGSGGQALLQQAGLTLISPARLSGSGIPTSLKPTLSGG